MPDIVGDDPDSLRVLSRSPHPYHRHSFELHEPSDRLVHRPGRSILVDNAASEPFPSLGSLINSTTASDSGTEADDEHFLKGLPAPKARLHKGLRGQNEPLSGSSTPLLSPAVMEEEGRKRASGINQGDKRVISDRIRRRRELVRRLAELLLLGFQGGMIAVNPQVQPALRMYQEKFILVGGLLAVLAAAYPLRVMLWTYRRGKPSDLIPLRIPPAFDPAPLLYPLFIPMFVSLLVSQSVKGAVLPNLVLGIAALPRALFPGSRFWETMSCSHWLLSCVPFALDKITPAVGTPAGDDLPHEGLILLYPLHQTLCLILHHLTTTSLLVAELQLFSIALINLLLLASSPQAIILQAVLWGGGLGLIVFCSRVIRWGISLARVPKWRFRRTKQPAKRTSYFRMLKQFLSLALGRPRHDQRTDYGGADVSDSGHSTDGYLDGILKRTIRASSMIGDNEISPVTLETPRPSRLSFEEPAFETPPRRHTLPSVGNVVSKSKMSTPSGRRKRSASSSVRAFFSLTQSQASLRKWLYAGYVYFCAVAVILVGIRAYVQRYALSGEEPIGWALGYLFGDLPQFRFNVVNANLESWICLPARGDDLLACSSGWVEHLRRSSLGEANTRLILCAYWVSIIVVGLAIVFRLSPICEVDTRRKVFHFMMVAMFLPTIYVDPTWIALALSIMLAVFLLLDLLRASQLPPLSKPLASFLTPYVDGRDLRGPVVISHIFLLIGCAIPLWLSLASLGRAGDGYLRGWEVPTREVSMVSGVVCVGLGDAAASLIGRRWGRRKWLWGGGKSIEGSLAFAVAVFGGLMAASLWLRIGRWPITVVHLDVPVAGFIASGHRSLMNVLGLSNLWAWALAESRKAALCASVASLTEAVLTGGNDNVVVPVVLWTCVKSIGM